jgi:hypothetical protein
MSGVDEMNGRHDERGLGMIAAEFAGQIATAVWLRKLSEEAAREALGSYARACHSGTRRDAAGLLDALVAEYRRRREQQDVCW